MKHSFLINSRISKSISNKGEFKYCPKDKNELKELIRKLLIDGIGDMSCIDISNITDMSYLFYNLEIAYHKILNVSNWDVSHVTDMDSMFKNCRLFNNDLSNWNVSNVRNFQYMFSGCYKFKGNGLEKWNVENANSSYKMFFYCESLNKDLSEWNFSSNKDFGLMFCGCTKLTYKPNWKYPTNAITKDMFLYCDYLK